MRKVIPGGSGGRSRVHARSERKKIRMKKILTCLLAGALTLALGACGGSSEVEKAETEDVIAVNAELEAEEETKAAEAESAAAEAAASETEAAAEVEISGEGEVATDKIALAGDETQEAETETAGEMAQEAADAPDVSQAVDGSATSETEPVPFGSWAKVSLYATQDSTYHTVYMRIVRVTTQTVDDAYVEAAIEANDGYGAEDDRFDPAGLDVPDDGELVVLDYEVYVPADFPAPSYGMTEPKFYFSMRNIDGGGFPSLDGSEVYVGMGTAQDLVVRDPGETYQPGETYGERSIYAMVKGYTDYVATFSSYPDGTASEDTSAENMYTVCCAVR